ncbi:hypothetical protein CCO03_04625 [Comamonas serinivorans]|uniref:Alkaline phytoceramidase n=1 Tax=Comamonas serinivorans TaxID=1082851 RepID=A0A1Y0EK86_9BURK|nr:hypothetical protein [Comamonas serinivorans]ARU04054.1 hypothetical protein CCO03_04625 [Comamonas serinivorans]
MRRAEWLVLLALLAAVVLAAGLPAAPLPAGYHDFADQRAWGALPHALDVLSNAPFVLAALWLWRRAAIFSSGIGSSTFIHDRMADHTCMVLVRWVVLGLIATAAGSSVYHWAPGDAGLAVDRLGMSLAFAGVIGLAVADRVSPRLGRALPLPLLLASASAALWAWQVGNMTPWALVQGAGLALLVGLGLSPNRPDGLGVRWLWVVLAYIAAKVLELGDHAVFELTQGWVAGHSLKHAVAALAVVPIGWAMRRR